MEAAGIDSEILGSKLQGSKLQGSRKLTFYRGDIWGLKAADVRRAMESDGEDRRESERIGERRTAMERCWQNLEPSNQPPGPQESVDFH